MVCGGSSCLPRIGTSRPDPLYAAYVLVLVLGLRRGEALGLTWQDVNLDTGEIVVTWQLQRTRGQLQHRETKTPGSEATLPLPDICVTALKLRAERQDRDRIAADDAWQDTGLVFTTRYGTPYEPRNFTRHFARAARRQASATSRFTTPAVPADRSWPRSTSTLASPCRSCGIARSPSRWRSIPRFRTPAPATHCGAWATSLTASVAVLLCCTGTQTRSLRRVLPGGAKGSRTPDLLVANQALCQLSYGPAERCSQGTGPGGPRRRLDDMHRAGLS